MGRIEGKRKMKRSKTRKRREEVGIKQRIKKEEKTTREEVFPRVVL